jgi:hypothetical protein
MHLIDPSAGPYEFPKPRELTPEEIKQAHALYKAQFTAADLQKYTEIEEGVPMEGVLKALWEKQRVLEEKKP